MRCVALVIALAFCSTATAAPVLVTKDNYKSAGDSPFDLAGGGFYLEDFEDGAVNRPGLDTHSKVIAGAAGAVSIENGASGYALRPLLVFDDLTTRTWTLIDLDFAEGNLGGLPTSMGFVWTQTDATTVAASLRAIAPSWVVWHN